MKKLILLFLTTTLFKGLLSAQECSNYYYLTNNNGIEMTGYDQNDKPSIFIAYRVSDVNKTSTGVQAKVKSEVKDEKGKILGGGEGIFKCEGGNLSADMQVSLSSSPMEQFKGMEAKSTASFMVYPGNIQVGQLLPDASFHTDIYNAGNLFGASDFTIRNRKVEGEEEITTPAGTWKCFRISYDMTMKTKAIIGFTNNSKATEWFAPGFGVIKSATFNKKGKQTGYMLLTKINVQ